MTDIGASIIMVLLLLPFEDTFKVDSKLWIYKLKDPSCEYNIYEKGTFHEDLNKHELVINKTKWQLIGTIC